jgi:hypothetical protein
LQAQTAAEAQFILVDDGSVDRGAEIAQEFCIRDLLAIERDYRNLLWLGLRASASSPAISGGLFGRITRALTVSPSNACRRARQLAKFRPQNAHDFDLNRR